jgi:membrane-bound serine protease (ClpP class)
MGFAAAMLLAGLVLGGLGSPAGAQSVSPTIVGLQLNGVVDPLVADYITGNIDRAQSDGAAAVLLQIDTPGGLGSSMREIAQGILGSDVPVICYVAPPGARAASAGAVILMSCPVAAMAPATNVGAATPIGLSGGDLGEKITKDAAAYIRGLAETYGRNADVAESFVTEATSISAEEALSDNVIDLIAGTREELLNELNGREITLGTGRTVTLTTAGVPVVDEGMGGFVGLLHALLDPNLAFIFFWLGLALVVLELLVPGHIFSGTIGTAMLVLAFASFGLLPVRLIGILLLIFSVVAFVIELKAPGLGIWGAAGTISLLLGGWFLYDRAGGVEVSPAVLIPVAAFVALFFGFVVAKVLRIRDLPPAQSPQAIVGAEGIVVGRGVNAKDGVVRVAAEEWRAVSPAGPLSPGTRVRVTRLDGLVLTVEPLTVEHTPAAPAPATEGG